MAKFVSGQYARNGAFWLVAWAGDTYGGAFRTKMPLDRTLYLIVPCIRSYLHGITRLIKSICMEDLPVVPKLKYHRYFCNNHWPKIEVTARQPKRIRCRMHGMKTPENLPYSFKAYSVAMREVVHPYPQFETCRLVKGLRRDSLYVVASHVERPGGPLWGGVGEWGRDRWYRGRWSKGLHGINWNFFGFFAQYQNRMFLLCPSFHPAHDPSLGLRGRLRVKI